MQSSLRNLDTAYKNFFRNIKKGVTPGFPNFKKFNSSVKYSNVGCKYNDESHKIWFLKTGWINVVDYKQPYGKLMNMTVSKSKSDKWFVSICVEDKDTIYKNNGGKIGIDVGLEYFLTDSNGNKIENPKYLKNSENKIIKLQKELSRKKIGSNNRKKAKIKLAKYHEIIAEQRKNFSNQLTTNIVKNNKYIAIETLNIKNMMQNKYLAKAIGDVAWGEFFRQLKYKAEWYDSNILEVGQFEPTSKKCNNCGNINKDLQLKDRIWICSNCGAVLDRDLNASKNILELGMQKINAG